MFQLSRTRDMQSQKGSKLRQTSINDAKNQGKKDSVHSSLLPCIPFNSARFDSLVEAITRYGRKFKPPSQLEVRILLLKTKFDYTNNLMKGNKDACANLLCYMREPI